MASKGILYWHSNIPFLAPLTEFIFLCEGYSHTFPIKIFKSSFAIYFDRCISNPRLWDWKSGELGGLIQNNGCITGNFLVTWSRVCWGMINTGVATRGVDEEAILKHLPMDLRREVKPHLCLDLVRKVSFGFLSLFH